MCIRDSIIREWQGVLVTSAAEVMEHLSPVGAPAGLKTGAVLGRDELDLETATVLDALPARGGMGPAGIAVKAGLDPVTVVRCLGALAAGGFAERCDEGWRVRRATAR